MFLNQDLIEREVKQNHENLHQIMASTKYTNPNQVSGLNRIRQFVQSFMQKSTRSHQAEVEMSETQEMVLQTPLIK